MTWKAMIYQKIVILHNFRFVCYHRKEKKGKTNCLDK